MRQPGARLIERELRDGHNGRGQQQLQRAGRQAAHESRLVLQDAHPELRDRLAAAFHRQPQRLVRRIVPKLAERLAALIRFGFLGQVMAKGAMLEAHPRRIAVEKLSRAPRIRQRSVEMIMGGARAVFPAIEGQLLRL